MSWNINEKHIGSKHYHEYQSPENTIVQMGVNATNAFHSLNGVDYITFDGTTLTTGDISVEGELDVSGDTSLEGDVVIGGNFTLSDTQWTDLKFPFTRDKQGQTSLPDFDFTNLGLLFPQNNETEEVYLIAQFGHDFKHGTDISPHIHFIQSNAAVPVFEMTYRWENNGDTVGPWITIETEATPVFSYVSGELRQILEFPFIDGSGIEGVSSMMDIIIRRQTGDGVTGDVLTKEFDIHYQIDALGSDSEYVK